MIRSARVVGVGLLVRSALLLVVLCTLASSVTPEPVAADPAPEISAVAQRYADARSRLADADDALRRTERAVADERRRWESAADASALAARRLEAQRDRYADLSADVYMRQGSTDRGGDESMTLALVGLRDAVRDAEAELGDAADAEGERADVLARSGAERDRARSDLERIAASVDQERAALDEVIAALGVSDITGVAYLAYQDAAAAVADRHPQCNLSAAVLAGVGRIASVHGQNEGASLDDTGLVAPRLRALRAGTRPDTDGGRLDDDTTVDLAAGPMQLFPDVWLAHAVDGSGDGVASIDNLYDAAATTAEVLCAGGGDLSGFPALDSALAGLLGDGQQAAVALGVARRYSLAAALDLGAVPADPRFLTVEGGAQYELGELAIAPGDVTTMIAWAMTRLGTPYSQCLGPDVRPQDPICPPGSNRFGVGFFDCSGFVSHAYRLMGLRIPQTTYAMEANADFMATKVSSGFDLRVLQPGDVFLMDGHTGMYVGDGMIVHAIGRGLTYEPVPRWVANGTFAVLRPVSLLPPPAPVLPAIDFAALLGG